MASKKPKFNGLTDDQVLMLFGQIATTVNLVSELCRDQAERYGSENVAHTLYAMNTLLRGVGALADHATGGNCIGDFAEWMVGPIFNQTQRAGGAI
jgi:hypothetical protein